MQKNKTVTRKHLKVPERIIASKKQRATDNDVRLVSHMTRIYALLAPIDRRHCSVE